MMNNKVGTLAMFFILIFNLSCRSGAMDSQYQEKQYLFLDLGAKQIARDEFSFERIEVAKLLEALSLDIADFAYSPGSNPEVSEIFYNDDEIIVYLTFDIQENRNFISDRESSSNESKKQELLSKNCKSLIYLKM